MRSLPRKFATDVELYAAAVQALARRSYSVHDMKVYLDRRSTTKEAVERILERLKDAKFLDDARYASQFIRTRTEIRRQGRFRILRDLRAHGIPDAVTETAFESQTEQLDESAAVRAHITRRLKTLRGPLNAHRTASLYRSLLRLGFSSETIRREMRSIANISIDEIPDLPQGEV